MNNNQEITINNYRQLFIEANKKRNLRKIYNCIEAIKLEKEQALLSELEEVCLRGLLCGYSPHKIAQKLMGDLDLFLIQVAFWNLFRYIQTMAERKEEKIIDYQDIVNGLVALGDSANNADTLLLSSNLPSNSTFSLPSSTENYVQPKFIREDKSDTPIVSEDKADSLIHQPRTNVLTSVDENDFMPAISPWTRLGGLFLVGSVGIAIAISAFTPYNMTVKAEAKVRPAGELRIVEAKTEGTVVAINVTENQQIQQGEIIATIDNSRLETQTSQVKSQIQQSRLQLGQINAQIHTLERQIKAEQEHTQRAIEVATVELSRSQREYQDRQITSTAEVAEAEANVRLAEEEWHQAQAQFTSAQANLKSNQAALASARSRRNRYQDIAITGALSQNQLEEAQLEVEQLEQQVAAQQATVEEQKRGIARQQQAVVAAQARLNNVRAALNPNNGEVAIARSALAEPIASERIAQERASGDAAAEALKRELEAMIQQRIELEQQLARDSSELQQLGRDIEQTVIKAPESGVLFQLSLRNPSQTVQPGSEIAQIAPKQTSLALEALVSSSDIGKVQIGQEAQVRISACPYPDYGTLPGIVKKISPDAIPVVSNPNSPNNQNASPTNTASFYRVKLQPDYLTLSQGINKCRIQLGMEGRADIVTTEETLLKFLLRKAKLLTDL
ncbi:HlyD family efflux transporter periplasmic adaptor subunit [Pleurocapsa sp. PCC 7319]|uniref:HlyD family efflux transporter periplasmic adaptor subunit n=1 Tax=Pleurocapsa sp. PCC 7319 TaxID=118161 RepID=UPI0003451E06|nr:HlyD family efflux transporter periplasmic adaptor subunit [Pleurocapsa sp. PCC 7319]